MLAPPKDNAHDCDWREYAKTLEKKLAELSRTAGNPKSEKMPPMDRTQYGPGFVAHLIVSKCGDSIPLYRLEKQYRRIGIPIARSTMTDLFSPKFRATRAAERTPARAGCAE